MKDIVYSETTGKSYYPSDCVRLVNVRQLVFYMNHGVEILDIYPSKDFKTGGDILVFIVNKEDSKNVYRMWNELRYD